MYIERRILNSAINLKNHIEKKNFIFKMPTEMRLQVLSRTKNDDKILSHPILFSFRLQMSVPQRNVVFKTYKYQNH